MTSLDLIATLIALLTSSVGLAYAAWQNANLQNENAWLRRRNKELTKQLAQSAPLPWTSAKTKVVN